MRFGKNKFEPTKNSSNPLVQRDWGVFDFGGIRKERIEVEKFLHISTLSKVIARRYFSLHQGMPGTDFIVTYNFHEMMKNFYQYPT